MKREKRFAILALVIALAVAGCAMRHHGAGSYGHGTMDSSGERGVQEMNALVDRTVQDSEKAKRVQAIVGEIVGEVKRSYQENREFHRKLYELNANYEAKPEEFTKILDELNNNRMRSASKILGMRYRMKELLTAQEWKALSEGMMEARGRYRHGRPAADGPSGGMKP